MSNGKADEVVDQQQTEALADKDVTPEGVETTEESAESTDSTSESLNFDELLGKDPHNKRGGLSRKEARMMKTDEDPEVQPQGNEVVSQLLNEMQELRGLVQGKSVRDKAETDFTDALSSAGVDVRTFNSEFKGDYLEQLEALQDEGMSTDKATKFALKMVLPKIEAKEAENRSNGRSRVKLPPTGLTQEKTTYKMSEIQKLVNTDRAKYKELMNRRDKGEITIV